MTGNALTHSSRPRKDFYLDPRHLCTIVPVCTYRRGALDDVTTVVALSRHQSEPLASVLVLAELGLEALLLLSGSLVSALLLVLSLDSRGHWPAGQWNSGSCSITRLFSSVVEQNKLLNQQNFNLIEEKSSITKQRVYIIWMDQFIAKCTGGLGELI